jgi:hypothetical protein
MAATPVSASAMLVNTTARPPDWDGVLVVSVDEREHGRELWLQLSTRPGFARDHRPEIQDLVFSLAKEFGCGRIVFDSKRRGWERVAASLGFTPEIVVRCTLEVPHGR